MEQDDDITDRLGETYVGPTLLIVEVSSNAIILLGQHAEQAHCLPPLNQWPVLVWNCCEDDFQASFRSGSLIVHER